MKLEMVFRIYRRLLRKSRDFCSIVILKKVDDDIYGNPTEVEVRFRPGHKRELSSTEKSILKHFCLYHNMKYRINKSGEMLWSESKTKRGRKKTGKE